MKGTEGLDFRVPAFWPPFRAARFDLGRWDG